MASVLSMVSEPQLTTLQGVHVSHPLSGDGSLWASNVHPEPSWVFWTGHEGRLQNRWTSPTAQVLLNGWVPGMFCREGSSRTCFPAYFLFLKSIQRGDARWSRKENYLEVCEKIIDLPEKPMTGCTVKLWPRVQLNTVQWEPRARKETGLISVVQYDSRWL